MLGQLYVKTAQLLQDLASLSDALNMLRQTALDVSRKLRTVKDHVEAMQREYSQAERSRMMLESNQWHSGIAERMVARQCRDICGGFEGTFERLRGRLVAQ
jgi:chromosome segregation ATPase